MVLLSTDEEKNEGQGKKERTVNNRKLWELLRVCVVCCVLCDLKVCCGIFHNTVMKNANTMCVCVCVCFFFFEFLILLLLPGTSKWSEPQRWCPFAWSMSPKG
jgi:hypothetical protein